MYSGRVNGGTIDTGRPHCSAAVSESGDTVKKKSSAPVFGNQDAIAQRSSPGLASNRATRQTLEPRRHICMRCKPTHPSPSAHQFRLPFNWLAPSELRRIFCSDEGAGAAIGKRSEEKKAGGLSMWGVGSSFLAGG
jgi:hypothetical protein